MELIPSAYNETIADKLYDGPIQINLSDSFFELNEIPPEIAQQAEQAGVEARDFFLRCLHQPTQVKVDGVFKRFIPGNIAGQASGRYDSTVFVMGKMPCVDEIRAGRNFAGDNWQYFFDLMQRVGLNAHSFFYTNVIRFLPENPDKVSAKFIKLCKPFIQAELELVNPQYILLLGTDSVKWFYGRTASLKKYKGVVDVVSPSRTIFSTNHPSQVNRKREMEDAYVADLSLFASICRGDDQDGDQEDYRYIYNAEQLTAFLQEMWHGGYTRFAMDAEWYGPDFRHGEMLTIQISWKSGAAAVIVLRDDTEDANPIFEPGVEVAIEMLQYFFDSNPNYRVMGHNLKEDLKWLQAGGLQLIKKFDFDTMLAHHLFDETGDHSLTGCSMKYAFVPRYDHELHKWREDNIPKEERDEIGFLKVPHELLLPYSAKDADVTFRLYEVFEKMMQEAPQTRWLFDNVTMKVQEPLLEMETTGVLVDRERAYDLAKAFRDKMGELDKEIRKIANNPEFNVRSYQQVEHLLFDELGLNPVKTTGKPPLPWAYIQPEDRHLHGRSTDQETLGILSGEHPIIEAIRRYRVVEQICKNFLRDPIAAGSKGSGKSLLVNIEEDGRVRATIGQLVETGRYNSARPNMMNLPKRQEKEFGAIFKDPKTGKRTIPTIRSCCIAPPKYMLVEADYKQAELNVLAHLADDETMKGILANPKRDLHSENAVTMFGLPCEPHEVKKRFKAERVAAKSISFGIPYQRGANAIARECKNEADMDMTKEEAQGHIDTFYERFPQVKKFIDNCKAAIQLGKGGVITNPFGRARHFAPQRMESRVEEDRRQAVNFPIQSTVAECLSLSLHNLFALREQKPDTYHYRLLLPVHDAILLEVPADELDLVTQVVMPVCMYEAVEIPRVGLHLGIDIEVFERWGEPITFEDTQRLGIDESYVSDD